MVDHGTELVTYIGDADLVLRIRNQLSKFELGVVKESEEEFRIVLKNSE